MSGDRGIVIDMLRRGRGGGEAGEREWEGEGWGHCQGTNGTYFGPIIGLDHSKQMVIPVNIIPEAGIKGKQTLEKISTVLCVCVCVITIL